MTQGNNRYISQRKNQTKDQQEKDQQKSKQKSNETFQNDQNFMSILIIPLLTLLETSYLIYIMVDNFKNEQYVYFWLIFAIMLIERLINLTVVNWYFVDVHNDLDCSMIFFLTIFLNFTYLDNLYISYNAMKYEERQVITEQNSQKNTDTVILEHKNINNGVFRSGIILFVISHQIINQKYKVLLEDGEENASQYTSQPRLIFLFSISLILFSFSNMYYFYIYCTYELYKVRKFFQNWEKLYYFFISFFEMLAKVLIWALLAELFNQKSIYSLIIVDFFFACLLTYIKEKNMQKPYIYFMNIMRLVLYFRAEPFIKSGLLAQPQSRQIYLKKIFGYPSRFFNYYRLLQNLTTIIVGSVKFYKQDDKFIHEFEYIMIMSFIAVSVQLLNTILEESIKLFQCIQYDWKANLYLCCDVENDSDGTSVQDKEEHLDEVQSSREFQQQQQQYQQGNQQKQAIFINQEQQQQSNLPIVVQSSNIQNKYMSQLQNPNQLMNMDSIGEEIQYSNNQFISAENNNQKSGNNQQEAYYQQQLNKIDSINNRQIDSINRSQQNSIRNNKGSIKIINKRQQINGLNKSEKQKDFSSKEYDQQEDLKFSSNAQQEQKQNQSFMSALKNNLKQNNSNKEKMNVNFEQGTMVSDYSNKNNSIDKQNINNSKLKILTKQKQSSNIQKQ